jgi:pimeloyl-ACP methyl ester carboxylesterase
VVWLIVLPVLILGLAALLPRWLEQQRHPPDQRKVPGRMVQLSRGRTHVTWHGPARGPVAVLIHGLTTPSEVWGPVAEGLAALGYRVMTYDLYGRGHSDAPGGRQDRAFFLNQLDDLLADQGLTGEVTLVGYSMGGAIATAFAARSPDRTKRLILIAPAGIVPTRSGVARTAAQVPVIGDWLYGVFGARAMRRHLLAGPGGRLRDVQVDQLDRRGFLPAVLGSLRGMLAERQEADHRTIGLADLPVIAIWGEDDAVIPIAGMGQLAAWNRNARQDSVADADHALPYSHGADVVAKVTALIRD